MIGNIVLIVNQDYAIIEEMSHGGIGSHKAEMMGWRSSIRTSARQQEPEKHSRK